MYSTKTFARLTGVTIKALRLYERLGLLVPKRTDTLHRRYTLADIQHLERVLALKSLGLELSAVQALVRGGDVSLRAHRERLEQQREWLDRAIAAVEHIEEHPPSSEAIDRFVKETTWARWEAIRAKRASPAPRVPDRAGDTRVALFRELVSVLDIDSSSVQARELATRWRRSIDADTWEALRHRARWPSGMRTYVASLYGATPETWERATAFAEIVDEAV